MRTQLCIGSQTSKQTAAFASLLPLLLTCWVSIDQEELEEEQDPVFGSDGDEPVAKLAVRRVLGGVTGTRDHSLL